MNEPRPVGCVFGGPVSLQFMTREEQRAYNAADFEMHMRFYHQQVLKYGVWAANQNKFVDSPDLLSEWDSKRDWHNYQTWLAQQPKE